MPDATQDSLPNRSSNVRLATVLVIPFTLIIVSVVILTSYLSQQNSQRVVNDAALEIIDDNTRQIELHLDNFFQTPSQINQTNATIIRAGNLDLSDLDAVSHYFWKIVQQYDSVTSIYFGYADGGLVLGGREGPNGALYIMQTDTQQANHLKKYATDEAGNLIEVLDDIPVFDARTRPWYRGAIENQGSYLTAPYLLSTGQNLAIASSLPVYDETSGALIGVLSVDIFIPHLDAFLAGLTIGQHGRAYIVEHSGQLVAISTDEPTFMLAESGDWTRIQALDSSNPHIANSAKFIEDNWEGFAVVDKQRQNVLDIDGEKYFLAITPYHRPNDQDWLIIILVPKSDFLAQIDAQNDVNFMIALIAGLIGIAFGLIVVMEVTDPIKNLTQAARALTTGEWSQSVPIEGVQEIQTLGNAFNTMAAQLHKNITDLEQRVAERTAELQTSQLRYQAIVEDQTELICRFAPDNILTFVNAAYCRYFNKSHGDLIGHSVMPLVPEEERHLLIQKLTQLNPLNPIVKTEYRIIKYDGSNRWMQWVNRAIYDEAGNLIEIQGVGRDITDLKRIQESLQHALTRETELNALKSHFISTVSHEFRTPLTIMMNASDILDRYQGQLEPAKQSKYLSQIQDQIERLANMLDDVLAMNRAERGSIEFEPIELDIISLCKGIIQQIKITAKKPVLFDFTEDVRCQQVVADKNLLELIFNNLISNATKYSEPNGTVKINLACHTDKIIFAVQDSGMGIPQEAQDSIFDSFYRANNVGTIQGTGLGLAIVKQSVRQYGGTIDFQSKLGEGTTFIVTLPHLPFVDETIDSPENLA